MKIVVATDGSFVAQQALLTALDLASKFREPVEVDVVAVVDYVSAPAGLGKAPVMAPDLLRAEAESALEVAWQLATERGIAIRTHLLHGHVVREVLTYAEREGAGMIVVGTHGRKGIVHAMLGSACEQIVRDSTIPVLAVHTAAVPA